MGLVIPWSFTLALADGYSVLVNCPLRQPGIMAIIVVGDWVCNSFSVENGYHDLIRHIPALSFVLMDIIKGCL